jgi:hypothetical protein
LLSGRDILSFFLPLIVTLFIALVDSWMRSERIHLTTDQAHYVYTRISFDFERFYFVYVLIAVGALIIHFRSKRRRIKRAATCALVGNLLLSGTLTLLWWAFRGLEVHD